MRNSILAIACATMLAACGDAGGDLDSDDGAPAETIENASFKARQATAEAPRKVLAEELLIRERSPTLQFSWRAPPELAEHPQLLDELRAQAQAQLANMRKDAREFAQTLVETEQSPRPLFYEQVWTVAYNSPGLLNLRSHTESYHGGAHGLSSFDSVFWDKQTGRRIEPSALFVNWPEARAELEAAYCEELDRMRAERRGAPVGAGSVEGAEEDPFNECPPLADQPLALDSGAGSNLMAFEVLLAPYEAGPYAEGEYEVRVPATDGLRDAVKAAYLRAP